MNACHFSPDRKYRYSLIHRWDDLVPERRRIMWVGLNPSTADEQKLDPTLRRIRDFSTAWGYNEFVMTNLFAFRATDPRKMKKAGEPIGADNDSVIRTFALSCSCIVICWGQHGGHLNRAHDVLRILLEVKPGSVCFLKLNADKSPAHPLYLPKSAKRQLIEIKDVT